MAGDPDGSFEQVGWPEAWSPPVDLGYAQCGGANCTNKGTQVFTVVWENVVPLLARNGRAFVGQSHE